VQDVFDSIWLITLK